MRIAYTADLHGNLDGYRALCEFAARHEAHAIIVGGDLLPHAIRRDDALTTQRTFVERDLAPLLRTFRSHHPTIAVYLLPGNDDWMAAYAAVEELAVEGLAYPLHERVYQLSDQLWLAGYACVPPTPFSIKDFERCDEGRTPPFSFDHALTSRGGVIRPLQRHEFEALPSIAEDLAMLAKRSDPRRTVYVCHTPPADTPLDLMSNRRHVGSRALRAFIEQHQPPLTLHGHIHEAPSLSGTYATQIGATWCVNPGRDQRCFHGVLIDLTGGAVRMEHTVYGVQPE
ncbi:MAG: metallophosphoesterase [Roseiflexus sp.]|nr:metallophosphoesterase [Roseiflexus sp.]MCS7288158.1 metallophosphoesterase [Roseiflexus sp.]MDW8145966.1 metallophosphoesterase [Roseiflexaceae bacterium]MDW8232576.1 metallophosphoesterase [Roseiflexaceae bacterium]